MEVVMSLATTRIPPEYFSKIHTIEIYRITLELLPFFKEGKQTC
jgi:hypothetical protein